MNKKLIAIFFALSIFSLSAMAETYTYDGTLVNDGGNIGISTSQNGFIALDDSLFSTEQTEAVEACLGKEVKAKVEDHGMVSELVSLSCK